MRSPPTSTGTFPKAVFVTNDNDNDNENDNDDDDDRITPCTASGLQARIAPRPDENRHEKA